MEDTTMDAPDIARYLETLADTLGPVSGTLRTIARELGSTPSNSKLLQDLELAAPSTGDDLRDGYEQAYDKQIEDADLHGRIARAIEVGNNIAGSGDLHADDVEAHYAALATLVMIEVGPLLDAHEAEIADARAGWKRWRGYLRNAEQIQAALRAEIERLREELSKVSGGWEARVESRQDLRADRAREHASRQDWAAEAMRLDAEVERLKAGHQIDLSAWRDAHQAVARDRDQARAEVKRLRGALEPIAEQGDVPPSSATGYGNTQNLTGWPLLTDRTPSPRFHNRRSPHEPTR